MLIPQTNITPNISTNFVLQLAIEAHCKRPIVFSDFAIYSIASNLLFTAEAFSSPEPFSQGHSLKIRLWVRRLKFSCTSDSACPRAKGGRARQRGPGDEDVFQRDMPRWYAKWQGSRIIMSVISGHEYVTPIRPPLSSFIHYKWLMMWSSL
jgi:hypothetical protein